MARLMSSAVADSCKADPGAGDCLQFYIDGVLKDARKKGVTPTLFTFDLGDSQLFFC